MPCTEIGKRIWDASVGRSIAAYRCDRELRLDERKECYQQDSAGRVVSQQLLKKKKTLKAELIPAV